MPNEVERKIVHLLRKKRLLIGCSSHVTPNDSYFAWSFIDKHNQSTPLVSFSSPVHGDTDQSSLLRADCFSLLGYLIHVDYLCRKFRKRFKAVHIVCNNTAAISSATQGSPLSAKTVFMDGGDVKAELRHHFKKLQSQVQIVHSKQFPNHFPEQPNLADKLLMHLSHFLCDHTVSFSTFKSPRVPHLPRQKILIRHAEDRATCNLPQAIFRYSINYEAECILQQNWKLSQDQMQNIEWTVFKKPLRQRPDLKRSPSLNLFTASGQSYLVNLNGIKHLHRIAHYAPLPQKIKIISFNENLLMR